MTFACAHFTPADDQCALLRTDCVPGRPGCVLHGRCTFVVPVEERIREAEQRRRERLATRPAPKDGPRT